MCLRESRELLKPSCQAAMERTETLFRTLNAQQGEVQEDEFYEDFPPPHHLLPFVVCMFVVCMCGRCARRQHCRKMKHVLKTLHQHPELLEAVEDAAGSPVPLPGWKNKMIAAINANPELKAAVEDAAQMQMPPSRGSPRPARGSKPSRSAHFCAMLMVIFSAMMLLSMLASLGCGDGVEDQEGMSEGQQQQGQVVPEGQEVEQEELDPMAGFFFSIFFGFMLILTCVLLCKCLRCWYRCVCGGGRDAKNTRYPGEAQAPLKERLIKRSPCGTELTVVYVGLPVSAPDVPELSKL
jgi:hypothetical protein